MCIIDIKAWTDSDDTKNKKRHSIPSLNLSLDRDRCVVRLFVRLVRRLHAIPSMWRSRSFRLLPARRAACIHRHDDVGEY
jgi:hypothetical protein